jgi:hypothetical protein
MQTYRVRWEIDIEADSAEEAAAQALITQRDNSFVNNATVFTVTTNRSGLLGEWQTIDLAPDAVDA